MSLLELFRRPDIHAGVESCRSTPGAVLLDVRTCEEYAGGHIPGSVNLPLDRLDEIAGRVPDRDTPLFVYCLSGSRSAGAVSALRARGYTRAANIGGISGWKGPVEQGG